MSRAFFVTGTDTEVGKTHATCVLLHAFARQGWRTLAMKPVAAGTDATGDNDDVVRLRAAANTPAPRDLVNPYCFAPAVAPHLAARDAGIDIAPATIADRLAALRALADVVIVEGAGGFLVPIGDTLDLGDVAVDLALPVILVVGLRLGCLNHALLTAEAITRRGLQLAGWIGNTIDPAMARRDDNLAALHTRLPAPCLGVLPWSTDPVTAAALLDLAPLADHGQAAGHIA